MKKDLDLLSRKVHNFFNGGFQSNIREQGIKETTWIFIALKKHVNIPVLNQPLFPHCCQKSYNAFHMAV